MSGTPSGQFLIVAAVNQAGLLRLPPGGHPGEVRILAQ
jgi:hypothetical protein